MNFYKLSAPPPQPLPSADCDDELDSCPNLKRFCTQGAYMNYMKDNCKATCNLCGGAKGNNNFPSSRELRTFHSKELPKNKMGSHLLTILTELKVDG